MNDIWTYPKDDGDDDVDDDERERDEGSRARRTHRHVSDKRVRIQSNQIKKKLSILNRKRTAIPHAVLTHFSPSRSILTGGQTKEVQV